MKRHSLLSMVFLLGIILIGLVGLPGPAGAAGISGRLVNKTPKGKGVEGAEVTLTAYRNEQEAGKTPTRTDRAGRFQFQDLSAKPGDTYTVTVRYQDAEYNTERIILENTGATRTLEIPVYDSTTDASQISVKVHHVVFSVADGSLRAEEVLLFRNSGDKAYVGAKEVAGGRRATLQFSLPAGAREVKYGEGLMECCVVPGEQGFVDTMDVKPGERQATFSYAVAPTNGRLQFVRPVDYRTEAVEVFVPEGAAQVSAEGLKLAGMISGQNQRFQRYTGPSLEVAGTIAVTLDNLPAIGGSWRPYAYASVGILLLAGVTYPVIRRRRVMLRAPSHASAIPPSVGAVATRPAGPLGTTELTLRKVELIAALAELEAGHEAGRVPEKEYRRLRQEKRKALRDVLAQLDEGRATAATTSGA
ncbi:MAG: carboxypeptidase regulatory-like domain-containing protein [candidate division NC10 bacterium]|nr:carboxypeptidase regulatory-like domain-containing protein [candidate division NC10 bacterium]